MEYKEILEGMDTTIKSLETKIGHVETELATEKARALNAQPKVEMTKEKKEKMMDDALRSWFEDGTKDFERFSANQQKILHVGNGDPANGPENGYQLIDEEMGRMVIEQMREPTSITGMVGSLSVGSTRYRQPVLQSYPTVAAGAENVVGADSPSKTGTQEYKEVVGEFIKVYSSPQYSNEAALDPHINIVSDLRRLLADEEMRYVAQQILFGDGTTAGDMRGILNSRIDLSNTFAEALKEDGLTDGGAADRLPDIYQVIPTGTNGSFGTDSSDILDFFIDCVTTLNSRWLQGSSWVMNRRTQAELMKIKDADGNPLLMSNWTAGFGMTLLGFPIMIEDYMPDAGEKNATPIIFGNLSQAFRILPVSGSDNMIQDPYTVKGTTILYHEWRLGECVFNHDAIKVIIQATDIPTA
ncbi:MAG: phage major capsid protein [Robiginitomaculum sp.]|nr:MAG: phage major capsid protein [Robiginitomaculum sp.]